jgi:hypothetical protein
LLDFPGEHVFVFHGRDRFGRHVAAQQTFCKVALVRITRLLKRN